MPDYVPEPYALILLALASFRVWRLLAWDTILGPYREWLIGRSDGGSRPLIVGRRYRQTLDEFAHCPWCLGFWVTVAWWVAWLCTDYTLVAAVPWAISALVGAASGILTAVTDD